MLITNMAKQTLYSISPTYSINTKELTNKHKEERIKKLEDVNLKRTEDGLVCQTCDTYIDLTNNKCPNCMGEWF